MCGIVAILNIRRQTPELRAKALSMAKKIRHRGPDWSGIYCGGTAILAHERLSIVDPQSGGQPLYSPDRKQILAVNGEIYNHREIRASHAAYPFRTGSDCETILALYRERGVRFLDELNGIFAFVLYDEERDEFLIARDPVGVIPLYIGRDADGTVYAAMQAVFAPVTAKPRWRSSSGRQSGKGSRPTASLRTPRFRSTPHGLWTGIGSKTISLKFAG